VIHLLFLLNQETQGGEKKGAQIVKTREIPQDSGRMGDTKIKEKKKPVYALDGKGKRP